MTTAPMMEMHNTYKINLSGRIQFGAISSDLVSDVFADGRLLGILMDDVIATEFCNVDKQEHINSGDVRLLITDDDGFVYHLESRVLTKNGANIYPSKMLGCGRKKNVKKRNAWIDDLHGFIISDVTDFPEITMKVVMVDDIINYDVVSQKRFSKLNTK